MAMNSVRFEALYKALSAAAQKVYAAVPVSGPATIHDIHSILLKQGFTQNVHHVSGCLNTLVRSGLVHETPRGGAFVRVEVRGKRIKLVELESEHKETEPPVAPQTPEPPKKLDPIDQLTQLSSRLRKMADDVEAIALDFTDQLEQIRKESKKLEALRSLLKEIA